MKKDITDESHYIEGNSTMNGRIKRHIEEDSIDDAKKQLELPRSNINIKKP